MRPKQEFKLQPDGMVSTGAKRIAGKKVAAGCAPVEIVLQPDLRKLTRIIRYVRRNPPPTRPIRIPPVKFLILGEFTRDVVGADRRHPTLAKTIRQLRIKAVIQQRFAGNKI